MAFDYLTVLISVVVGLSVTSFLTNVVRIIRVWQREDFLGAAAVVRGNSGLDRGILVVHVCTRQTTAMDVSVFVFLLVYATLLYVLMALLFPEGVPGQS